MIKGSNKIQLAAIVSATLLAVGIGIYAAGMSIPSLKPNSSSLSKQTTTLNNLILPTADAASSDYFLKIEGVDGEAKDDRHKGEIEIQSFSWGVSNPGSYSTGSGAGSGKASFSSFNIMKSIDKATPKLFELAATGEHIKEITLTGQVSGANPSQWYTITMQDVVISGFWQATPQGEVSYESVSFNYAKIVMQYTPMSADGTASESIKAGYDVKAAKGI
jgi:type VI secretion system secreted protein Hcp